MHYHSLGNLPKKRHVTFLKQDGTLHREHLFGLEGFSGIQSLAYKLDLPSATLAIHPLPGSEPVVTKLSDSLTYRHLKTGQLPQTENWLESRTPLMFNQQVEISVGFGVPEVLFRNASHHELWFLETGQGWLRSEFGNVQICGGDYVVIPKGLTYQFQYSQGDRFLLTQSLQPIRFPKRYLNHQGQFLEHSPICERDLKLPTVLETIDTCEETTIIIRRGGRYFEQVMNHHPFDTVGWDGCYYPFAISIHDFEPIVGRLHLPPPIHQIFESKHFVVCNFVPRLFDFHPEAIPAPYYHSNIDSDEVIFYIEGNFMSRSGIEPGSISLHPAGIPHGPQPGKTEASVGQHSTEELAVMIDTFEPLLLSSRALEIEEITYERSWIAKK